MSLGDLAVRMKQVSRAIQRAQFEPLIAQLGDEMFRGLTVVHQPHIYVRGAPVCAHCEFQSLNAQWFYLGDDFIQAELRKKNGEQSEFHCLFLIWGPKQVAQRRSANRRLQPGRTGGHPVRR